MPREGGRAWSGPGSHSAVPGDSSLKPQRILLAALLASTLLAFTPTARAQEAELLDTFEQYAAGFWPPVSSADWVFQDYATTTGTANEVELVSTPSVTGKAIHVGGHTGSTATLQAPSMEFGREIACDGSETEGFEFDFRIAPGAVDNTNIQYRIQFSNTGGGSSMFRLDVFSDDVTLVVEPTVIDSLGNTHIGTGLSTLTTDEWWHFNLIGFDCLLDEFSVSMAKTADGSSLATSSINGALAGTILAPNRVAVFASTGDSADVIPDTYLDNMQINASPPGTAGFIFCADPSIEAGEDGSTDDFGYEYVEDWTYETDMPVTGLLALEDGFVAELPDGNTAYFGKGLSTGSPALAVRFRIEAANDGEDSVFRAAFTEGNSGTPSSVIASASNGGTDGSSFDDHVGVRFEEEGNQWRITFRQNVAGGGYNTIGSSFTYGNPNSPKTFNFTADSRNLTVMLHDGDTGGLIESRTINAAFQDQLWEDQWFMATGTSTLADAFTVLDDNTDSGDSDDSTCIYDLTGEAVVTGSEGSTPGSTIVNPPAEPPEPGAGSGGLFDPANLDSQLFVGFLLVAGMVFIGVRQGVGQAAISALAAVGLFLGYALGWIPLWIIIVLTILGIAVIFLFGGQKADGVS